jgi:hypothetical protein
MYTLLSAILGILLKLYDDSIDTTAFTLENLENVRITVNKNANTQSVMIYGDVGLYEYPQITTELGDSLLTEVGAYLLIG